VRRVVKRGRRAVKSAAGVRRVVKARPARGEKRGRHAARGESAAGAR
jgi:hypothetical protein